MGVQFLPAGCRLLTVWVFECPSACRLAPCVARFLVCPFGALLIAALGALSRACAHAHLGAIASRPRLPYKAAHERSQQHWHNASTCFCHLAALTPSLPPIEPTPLPSLLAPPSPAARRGLHHGGQPPAYARHRGQLRRRWRRRCPVVSATAARVLGPAVQLLRQLSRGHARPLCRCGSY